MAKMPGGAIPGLRETSCLRAREVNNALLAEAADAMQRHCPRLSIPAVLAEPVTVYWPAGSGARRGAAGCGAAVLCCRRAPRKSGGAGAPVRAVARQAPQAGMRLGFEILLAADPHGDQLTSSEARPSAGSGCFHKPRTRREHRCRRSWRYRTTGCPSANAIWAQHGWRGSPESWPGSQYPLLPSMNNVPSIPPAGSSPLECLDIVSHGVGRITLEAVLALGPFLQKDIVAT
jgi:hypothetical protein